MNKKTKELAYNAIIAAVYVAITLAIAPIAYGPIQFRVSEVMTLLVLLNPRFAPGLIIGCLIANLYSPLGLPDVIFGTTATTIAVFAMTKIKNIFAASLMPTIVNGIIIGIQLWYLFDLPLLESMFYVALGEFVVVSIIGIPLFKIITAKFPKIKEADI